MKVLTFGVIVSIHVCTSSIANPGENCSFFRSGIPATVSTITDEGFKIEGNLSLPFKDVVPERGAFVFDALEFLSAAAELRPYYISGQNTRQFNIGSTWVCQDKSECAKAYAKSMGLEFGKSEQKSWVLGTPEELEKTGVVVFTYPIDQSSLDHLETSRQQFDNALFGLSAARYWGRSNRRVDWVGIGFLHVDSDPGSWIVVVSRTTEHRLEGRVMRVRFSRSQDSLECDWVVGRLGLPIAEFSEDVTGDGIGDFLFQVSFGDAPDFLVDGASGALLAEFVVDHLAVEKTQNNVPRIAAKWNWGELAETEAAVFLYSDDSRSMSQIRNRNEEGEGSSETEKGRRETGPRMPNVAKGLNKQGIADSDIHVFVLPRRAITRYNNGVDVTICAGSELWTRLIMEGGRFDLAEILAKSSGVSVVMSYLPEYFQQQYSDIWGHNPIFR